MIPFPITSVFAHRLAEGDGKEENASTDNGQRQLHPE
jgi:hypothetical protein